MLDGLLLRHDPEAPLLTTDRTYRRRDVAEMVDELAARMARAGLASGGVLALRVNPGVAFVASLLAALRADVRVLVIDHRTPDAIAQRLAALARAGHELRSTARMPPTRGFDPSEDLRIAEVAAGRLGAGWQEGGIVQPSSGTTHDPRLCLRSADDMRREVDDYAAVGGLADAGERLVFGGALSSAWGVHGALACALATGAELVLPASLLPSGLAAAAGRDAARARFVGVPAQVRALARLPEPVGFASACVSGGGLGAAEVDGMRARDGMARTAIGQVYGMTEVGMIAADPRGEHPGTVGRLGASVEARVDGEGALWLRRPESPYLQRVPGDRWDAGWFGTNDAVDVGADGIVTHGGRIDGLLSLGGRKVHVDEVEALVRDAPGVVEAVAFLDDATLEAFVQLEADATLDERAMLRRIPEHLRPHRITVLETMPRTITGKVLRRRAAYPGTPGGG